MSNKNIWTILDHSPFSLYIRHKYDDGKQLYFYASFFSVNNARYLRIITLDYVVSKTNTDRRSVYSKFKWTSNY